MTVQEFTPLISPVQNNGNPYEVNENQYLSYRHLRLIPENRSDICNLKAQNGSDMLCSCCRIQEIAYTTLPSGRSICFIPESYRSRVYGPIAVLLAGGSLLTIGGFWSLFMAIGPASAATSKLMAIIGGSSCITGSSSLITARLSTECLNAARRGEFETFITELCQEAGGDEEARVRDDHIPRVFPLMNDPLYAHMDFAQTEACYAAPQLRDRLIERLLQCKPEIYQIWQRVQEIHRLPSDEFIKTWNNRYFAHEIRKNETLFRLITAYLPSSLSDDSAVQETLARPLPDSDLELQQEASSSESPSLPVISFRIEPREKVKQNLYFKFVINKKFFVIERNFLAPFFEKVIEDLPNQETQSTLDRTISVELNIPPVDHQALDILLTFLQTSQITIDDVTIGMIHKMALKYDLVKHLRQKLCQIPPTKLYDLLTIAYTLNWEGLQLDVPLGILAVINTSSIETFNQTIENLQLLSICRLADELGIVMLHEKLQEKFTECFKYVIDKIKKNQFGENLREELIQLALYAKSIDATLEFLPDGEFRTLQYELKNEVEKYMMKSTDALRVLSTVVSEVPEMYLLKTSVLQVMANPQLELMVKHAYAFGMPDALYQLLYNSPASSSQVH